MLAVDSPILSCFQTSGLKPTTSDQMDLVYVSFASRLRGRRHEKDAYKIKKDEIQYIEV